ncbi:MAG: cytochrome c [Planctomycetes bacterium]|nr:cytochrome c [Planctomycetota bacterium]
MKYSKCLISLLFSLVGCHQRDMEDQPRADPLEASAFFEDGQAARPLVEGTVARGHLRVDEHLFRGRVNGAPAGTFPFQITRADLERGRERYAVFCAPCHDLVGAGQGMVVRRGYQPPPSFHIDRLRQAPIGHFFQVMTEGLGAMPSYAHQVPPHDRWRIAAYVRALQLSQHALLDDVPPQEREKLRWKP